MKVDGDFFENKLEVVLESKEDVLYIRDPEEYQIEFYQKELELGHRITFRAYPNPKNLSVLEWLNLAELNYKYEGDAVEEEEYREKKEKLLKGEKEVIPSSHLTAEEGYVFEFLGLLFDVNEDPKIIDSKTAWSIMRLDGKPPMIGYILNYDQYIFYINYRPDRFPPREYRKDMDNFMLDIIESLSSIKKTTANLYFFDDQAMHLFTEERKIRTDNLFKNLMEELIRGPESEELRRTVPSEAKVISVDREENMLIVDFSKELSSDRTFGHSSEYMRIYSVINTATQFEEIDKVKLLMEGEMITHYGGHDIAIENPATYDKDIVNERN